ncbi:MAG: hypothetical protein ACR2O3_01335 [Rhizobiaceae bacterium]
MRLSGVVAFCIVMSLSPASFAQQFEDASEAARKTSNPLGGDFMPLINEWTFSFKNGSSTTKQRNGITQIFQPVIPISLEDRMGPNWIAVHRPTFPFIWDTPFPTSPDLVNGPPKFNFENATGFGDVSHFSLVGTSTPSYNELLGNGDLVLAAGFSLNIPIGSDKFTTNAWAAGPAGVAAFIGEKGILGALAQSQYDFASTGDAIVDYDRIFVQPFYYINLDDGWQIGGAPLMTFNLDTDVHITPVGLGITKTQMYDLGDGKVMPVKYGLEGRYNLSYDSSDPLNDEWSIVFSITPILPNVVSNLLKGCPAMSVGGC